MGLKTLSSLEICGKRVVIREDFNVPLDEAGQITSDARIRAAIPTLTLAFEKGAEAVIVLSHLGRPTEGVYEEAFSLAPVAKRLETLMNRPVRFVKEYLQGFNVTPGELILCENVRFQVGEKKEAESLARQLAALGDVFVMDAFATAHRAEASTCAIARYAPIACAGPLLEAELTALGKALDHPARPLLAIVGGSKVSTKLTLLENLLTKVDRLIVGGGIANTFLAAKGYEIGKSLFESDLIDTAQRLLKQAELAGKSIPLPVDVRVATEFSPKATAQVKKVGEIQAHEMILDIGPETEKQYARIIAEAGTVVWNGPVGVFEFDAFSQGTKAVGEAIAHSQAFSLAGGGDTIAAIDQAGIASQLDYISTAGGAFLEFLEGKTLPAVAALNR